MDSGKDQSRRFYDVDICATLLTDTPPKLPLREELPSLGFEVIYHAAGVGVKASKHAAKRAAKRYRKMQENRDKKKWRLLPQTAKQRKEKLEKRQQQEMEILHSRSALSYNFYNNELKNIYEDNEPRSFSSGSSARSVCASKTSSLRIEQKQRKRAPHKSSKIVKKWRVFKFNSSDSKLRFGQSELDEEDSDKIEFPDVLTPMNLLGDIEGSDSDTKEEDISGSCSDGYSYAYSSISSAKCERDPGGVKMLFVTSPSTRKYLPEITSTDESDDDAADTNQQGALNDYNLCTDTYAIAHNALDNALEKTFPDFLGSFESMDLGFGLGRQQDEVKNSETTSNEVKKKEDSQGDKPAYNTVDGEISNPFSGMDMLFTAGSDVFGAASEVILDGGNALSRIGSGVMGNFSRAGLDVGSDKLNQKDSQGTQSQVSAQNEGPDKGQSYSRLSSDWLSAAVSAFGSIAFDFYNSAAGLSDEKNLDFLSDTGTIEDLFTVLANANASVDHIRNFLSFNPEYIQIRRHHDKRLPLHVLCDRQFPDRSAIPVRERMRLLLQDVGSFRDIVFYVKNLYSDACLCRDAAGDLPVHLLARAFMCWEAQWYEAVYEEAAKDQRSNSKTAVAITYLYQLMSESVEFVLEPMIVSPPLCRLPGSVGKIFPLHIASIFTASVKTLRVVLKAYPQAASIKCDLGEMKTFVPNHVTPLELHDLLSTDFPKWETQRTTTNSELSWSASQQSNKQDMEDCIRRSDLLFAFNPISPYRYEKSRIRRLEARIEHEAKQAVQNQKGCMSYASERIWIWMCTFSEEKTGAVTYLNSVKRIANALDHETLKYLISLKNEKGECVIDIACCHCITVLQKRLDRLSENNTSLIDESQKKSDRMNSRPVSSSVLSVWNDRQIIRQSFSEKGTLNHLCRLIFDVNEISFPTSFIVLPYRLSVNEGGALGVESPNSVDVALQFADHLLEMTDPRSLLYYLDTKSIQYYGESLYGVDENPIRLKAYETVKENEKILLSLYEPGEAYLYLIDELTGIPVLSKDTDKYPVVLNNSVNLVTKLLPLMLIGMLQLRGEKAFSIMVSILLDGSVAAIPPKWIDAAKEAGAYYSAISPKGDISISEASSSTADELVQFIAASKNKLRLSNKPKNGTTEWNIELSILKMLLEMRDSDRSYNGLRAMKSAADRVLWSTGDMKGFVGQHRIDGGVLKDRPVTSADQLEMDVLRTTGDARQGGSGVSSYKLKESTWAASQHSSTDSESEEALNFPQPHFAGSFHSSCSASNKEALIPRDDSSDSDELRQTLPAMDSVSVFLSGTKREELFPKPRYTCFFDQLAIQKPPRLETDDILEPKRIFDEGGRIWSEISSQLERGFYEDASTLRLRVDIAQQAKQTSLLNKKMHELLELHARVFSHKSEDYIQWEWSRNGYNTASDTRKLVLRLGDLEDRILQDAIDLQHTTLRAYALAEDVNWVEAEGNEEERPEEEEIDCDRIIMSRDEADEEEMRNESTREQSGNIGCRGTSTLTRRHDSESSSDANVLDSDESEPERSSYINNKTRAAMRGQSQSSSTVSLWGSSRRQYIHSEVASRDDDSETSGRSRLPTSISFPHSLLDDTREAGPVGDAYDFDSEV
ncbi:hypothetical protein FisN_4Lh082 [Fistulifera solaris]|uniref:Uncharacterized protein n=1 Tax=Fistulifera solaris TaxID=1519565 RepID=A0A1Z5JZS8_FISSO|nr:hypothetical protein FisN_4Lh082 [Fistulifera solaris]|eukprot:GAX19338.1 hypothetical protein FisN_4Lh082 [Fistulifera solaris]